MTIVNIIEHGVHEQTFRRDEVPTTKSQEDRREAMETQAGPGVRLRTNTYIVAVPTTKTIRRGLTRLTRCWRRALSVSAQQLHAALWFTDLWQLAEREMRFVRMEQAARRSQILHADLVYRTFAELVEL